MGKPLSLRSRLIRIGDRITGWLPCPRSKSMRHAVLYDSWVFGKYKDGISLIPFFKVEGMSSITSFNLNDMKRFQIIEYNPIETEVLLTHVDRDIRELGAKRIRYGSKRN